MQVCVNCVMDTTDPSISFDTQGICSYCLGAEEKKRAHLAKMPGGVPALIEKLRNEGKGKPFDCIIGLSGGVDSSYLLHLVAGEWKLRVLAVHVDGGWNSDEAVSNIHNLVNKLGVKLHTIVVDWEEMKDLQCAFLRAGVSNQDTPQDHAFFAGLYGYAIKTGVRYVLSGHNLASESVLPKTWGYDAMDLDQLQDIHGKFGTRPLKTFPRMGFWKTYVLIPYVYRFKILRPLNLVPYHREEAIEVLKRNYGWKDYGPKHNESRFTRFFQNYFLPSRFGFDKRKAHYSSLILSGSMTRAQAVEHLSRPAWDVATIHSEGEFVAKKLGMSYQDLSDHVKAPLKSHLDYKNHLWKLSLLQKLSKWARRFLRATR
jgi:N-acetyl sugar amidotransferase